MGLKKVLGTQEGGERSGEKGGGRGKRKESGRVERGAWRWQRLDLSQAEVG